MLLPPERRVDVLAVLGDRKPMAQLLAHLRRAGFGVDVVDGVQSARAAFFGAGGHHCVVLGPDVSPGTARLVVTTLRTVDPELPLATFGPELPDSAPTRTARLAGFHPGSRAGVGALLRFLRAIPDR